MKRFMMVIHYHHQYLLKQYISRKKAELNTSLFAQHITRVIAKSISLMRAHIITSKLPDDVAHVVNKHAVIGWSLVSIFLTAHHVCHHSDHHHTMFFLVQMLSLLLLVTDMGKVVQVLIHW